MSGWRKADAWHIVHTLGYTVSRSLDGRQEPPRVTYTAWTPAVKNERGWTTTPAKPLLYAPALEDCITACLNHWRDAAEARPPQRA